MQKKTWIQFCEQPTLKVLQAIFCSVRSHLCMQHRRGIFLFQSDNFVTGFSRSPHNSHYCTLSTSPGKGTRNSSYHFWAEPHHHNSILGQRRAFRLCIPASGSWIINWTKYCVSGKLGAWWQLHIIHDLAKIWTLEKSCFFSRFMKRKILNDPSVMLLNV